MAVLVAANKPVTDGTTAQPTNAVAHFFMQALRESESQMDPTPLLAFFGDDARLSNLRDQGAEEGIEGARTFWQNYLAVFQTIRSEFHQVIETADAASLEWISEGMLSDGTPIRYKGISVLETSGDRVTHFRTYYDSAAFLAQGKKQTTTNEEDM